jgi:hypothetical protein
MIEGMTLKDWFAGQALASMAVYIEDGETFPSDMAEIAYMYAYEMMSEKFKLEEEAKSIKIEWMNKIAERDRERLSKSLKKLGDIGND